MRAEGGGKLKAEARRMRSKDGGKGRRQKNIWVLS
jgi:hypothetical protein